MPRHKAFAVSHADDVLVYIKPNESDDTKFDVTVRKAGKDVETHPGQTSTSVKNLKSKHVDFEHIDPPGPAEG
ncbi:MAG: hypothetical protein HKM89_04695 [Gemmatimonadales bacterium]|nr:hypothetical protein [Gemmatimonadales bacterium]